MEATERRPVHYAWTDVACETLKGSLTRRIITGDTMMIAEVVFKKGDVVPVHAHHNEQITHILSGALKFTFGDGRETIVRGGEVLVIPAHAPHGAEALEDTVDVDIFSPPREDWLNGTDTYIRSDSGKM